LHTEYAAEKFLEVIHKKFKEGQQEDAHEALRYLIDRIYPKSICKLIFGGELQSIITCKRCQTSNIVNEMFLDISLEINEITLEKCFENFCREEVLDGTNKCYCAGCKRKSVSCKKFVISSAPVVFTIHLKRFENSGKKGESKIAFPEKMDLKRFLKKRERTEYELYAVLVHAGKSCRVGHYYSYIKGPDGVWYLANDLAVSKSDIKKVLNDRSAYIIFYKKISSDTENPVKKRKCDKE
jgi:ubiquitin carboxyl-terminal hydrolase 36/42